MISLSIGGIWAEDLGYGKVGDVEISHTYSSTGGGLNYVKFALALPRGYYHPVLREGVKVEVFRGPVKLGSGILADPDRVNWTFVADGVFKQAEKAKALDSLGNVTSNVSVAVAAAVARGDLKWSGAGTVPSSSLSSQAETQNEAMTVADLFNATTTVGASRWGVDLTDTPYVVNDPIAGTDAPVWALTPGIPLMPTSDENYASMTYVRYVTAMTAGKPSAWATVSSSGSSSVPDGHAVLIDVSDQGVIPSSQAQVYANDYQAKNARRWTFTEGIDVTPGQLTTPGGTPIDHWAAGITIVGKLGVHFGAFDQRLGTTIGQTVQWVCGSTVYKPGDNSLQIFGVDLAARATSLVIARLADYAAQRQANVEKMGLVSS